MKRCNKCGWTQERAAEACEIGIHQMLASNCPKIHLPKTTAPKSKMKRAV